MVHLLHDAWIPVIRKDGKRELITPDQITSDYNNNPVQDLDAPRPDFNGALIQFLVGLIQTTMPPLSDREWVSGLEQVPEPVVLKKSFEKFDEAFIFDGDGSRFMQDQSALDGGDCVPIRNMLIEYPAGRNMFVKNSSINQICPLCAAQAIFTFQLNGPTSGRGHYSGIRGSNPITCVIPGPTLWKTVYLNVLPTRVWSCSEIPDTIDISNIFPWLGDIRTKEKYPGTSIQDVHPLQVFWGMSNRFYLNLESSGDAVCDLCGKKSDVIIREFSRKPYGINYDDTWGIHPLTPHQKMNGILVPGRLKPEKITYRHYPDLTHFVSSENNSPALIVTHYNKIANSHKSSMKKIQLWSFGFDLDNAKAKCWYECRIPVFVGLEDEDQAVFENRINNLVQTAEYIQQKLSAAIKPILLGKEPDIIKNRYWNESESVFFETVEKLFTSLDDVEATNQIKKSWLQYLRQIALSLFDEYTQVSMIQNLQNAEVVVKERRNLMRFTGEKGKKIRTLLGLLMDSKQENN